MNTQMIQIAALAAGGYFLYDWFSKKQAAAAPPATTPPTGGTTPPTGGTTTPPPAPPARANANPTDENLKRAAAYEPWALEAGTRVLNFHQWNFYRREFNPQLATPAPESVGQGDGNGLITASQYHAALKTGGLSGVLAARGLAGLALRRAAAMR